MSQWRSEVEEQRTNGTDGDHFRPVFLFGLIREIAMHRKPEWRGLKYGKFETEE